MLDFLDMLKFFDGRTPPVCAAEVRHPICRRSTLVCQPFDLLLSALRSARDKTAAGAAPARSVEGRATALTLRWHIQRRISYGTQAAGYQKMGMRLLCLLIIRILFYRIYWLEMIYTNLDDGRSLF